MKKIRFLQSVAGDSYAYSRGWEGLVHDSVADSEVNAGNAEYIFDGNPTGLQTPQPKRKPDIQFPNVHTTVIKKGASSGKKKPTKTKK